jgi:hypothetical protein
VCIAFTSTPFLDIVLQQVLDEQEASGTRAGWSGSDLIGVKTFSDPVRSLGHGDLGMTCTMTLWIGHSESLVPAMWVAFLEEFPSWGNLAAAIDGLPMDGPVDYEALFAMLPMVGPPSKFVV